jgi:hypothetical protein
MSPFGSGIVRVGADPLLGSGPNRPPGVSLFTLLVRAELSTAEQRIGAAP